MSERKNIDKLFQEKFKDFEMEPPEQTWPEIEVRLKKKKDRKIIPFWWRLSGVAAALVIGLLITNRMGFFHNDGKLQNGVVIEDNPKVKAGDYPNSGIDPIKNNEAVTENDTNNANPKDNNKAIVTTESTFENGNENQEASENGNYSDKKQSDKKFNKPNGNNNDAIVNVPENNKSENGNNAGIKNRSNKKISTDFNKIQKSRNEIAGNESVKGIQTSKKDKNLKTSETEKLKTNPENSKVNNAITNNEKTISDDKKTVIENKTNTAIAVQNTKDPKSNQTANLTDAQSVSEKPGTTDNKSNPIAVTNDKNPEKKLDSAAIATVVPNALEELLKEKENKVTKEPKLNRWQITSNVAPIYFGSTSQGSPIDSTFANNSKDYNTNMSYGLGVNYAINKKFAIRTGINRVSFNYNTNDVFVYTGFSGSGHDNIDTSEENETLNLSGKQAATSKNLSSSATASADGVSSDKFEGYINQKMGYIEVPIEVSYAVLDKRFGINVIAGVSTLFLNENRVLLVADGLNTNLGEANNLNKTHFSSNVGLGLKYSIIQSLQVNFEPIFKYQLNTFSKDSGNFKPYFFGLYTGLSFRF